MAQAALTVRTDYLRSLRALAKSVRENKLIEKSECVLNQAARKALLFSF